jgi:hypothetical protein
MRLSERLPFMQRTTDGRTVGVTQVFDTLTGQELETLKAVGSSLVAKSDADGRELLINAQLFLVR